MKLYDRWPLTVTMVFIVMGVAVLMFVLYFATVAFGRWATPVGIVVALFVACVLIDVNIRRKYPPL